MPFEGLAGALLPPRPSPPVRAGAVAGGGGSWVENRLEKGGLGYALQEGRGEGLAGGKALSRTAGDRRPDSCLNPPLSDLASD